MTPGPGTPETTQSRRPLGDPSRQILESGQEKSMASSRAE